MEFGRVLIEMGGVCGYGSFGVLLGKKKKVEDEKRKERGYEGTRAGCPF